MVDALVIGAGPAGLMAAEALAQAGRRVVVCEAKPSVGRKFLMAGKSGLNITHAGPGFAETYGCERLAPMLAAFGPRAVQDWCKGLGQEVFTGSTGRVFPVAMKASPLLRAWMGRLAALVVEVRTRWRWTGFTGDGFAFDTPGGAQVLQPAVTVLALGGASWARLGSDGAWAPWLAARGVPMAPFQPANMGFKVGWSAHIVRFAGTPVKGVALTAGTQRVRGEFVITARGVEGGGIYTLSRALREGATLTLDLAPDMPLDEVEARLARMRSSETQANRLRKLGLTAVNIALMQEFGRGLPLTALKALPVPLRGPGPLDGAISVAGGVDWAGVTKGLALAALPRVHVCGEMLDWEAPTGGYLLTACLATGLWAGRAAAGTEAA